MRALEGQELAGRLSHICAAEDFLSSYRGDMFPSLGGGRWWGKTGTLGKLLSKKEGNFL